MRKLGAAAGLAVEVQLAGSEEQPLEETVGPAEMVGLAPVIRTSLSIPAPHPALPQLREVMAEMAAMPGYLLRPASPVWLLPTAYTRLPGQRAEPAATAELDRRVGSLVRPASGNGSRSRSSAHHGADLTPADRSRDHLPSHATGISATGIQRCRRP